MFDQNYIIGESARITLDVTDLFGTAVDAVDIVLKVKPPSEAISNVEAGQIVRASLGSYYFNQSLDKPGTWYYRWEVGTPATSVAEGQFVVDPSRFKP